MGAALVLAWAALAPGAAADPLKFTIAGVPATRLDGHGAAPSIPPGFVGASIDYCSITYYVESASSADVLANLLGWLAGGPALLRVGGNGPEAPCPGDLHHPPSTAIAAISRLESLLRARLLLGIDLEAHRLRKARREVRALLHGLAPHDPRSRIAAFEIGNEPDRYKRYGGGLPRPRLRPFFARFLADFWSWAQAIRDAARDPGFPVAGPALGRPGLPWITPPSGGGFMRFVNGPARPAYLTFHRYALFGVGVQCPSPACPTMQNLLSEDSSRGLAASLAPFVAQVPHGRTLRVDEINSITGGGVNGVSSTLASALWALDTTFELARLGVSGVNFHTFSKAAYAMFSRTRGGWLVHPEYYGLLMFARAAPPGSQLLQVDPDRVLPGAANVKVWATRGSDGRTRVLIINKEIAGHYVSLAGAGLPDGASATLQLLRAAPIGGGPACPAGYGATGMCAFGAVTLGGQSFGRLVTGYPAGDATTTGRLAPPSGSCAPPLPDNCELTLQRSGTLLAVPAASALLLTTT